MRRATKLLAAATAAAFLCVELVTPAAAAAACFEPGEIEADQAVRYQTELMVLQDTCGGGFYRDFTVRNRDQIVSYQSELKAHFRRIGARSPENSLDHFMTETANELALRAGHELRAEVCARSAQVIAEAKTLDAPHFRSLAAALASENRGSYRRCR